MVSARHDFQRRQRLAFVQLDKRRDGAGNILLIGFALVLALAVHGIAVWPRNTFPPVHRFDLRGQPFDDLLFRRNLDYLEGLAAPCFAQPYDDAASCAVEERRAEELPRCVIFDAAGFPIPDHSNRHIRFALHVGVSCENERREVAAIGILGLWLFAEMLPKRLPTPDTIGVEASEVVTVYLPLLRKEVNVGLFVCAIRNQLLM